MGSVRALMTSMSTKEDAACKQSQHQGIRVARRAARASFCRSMTLYDAVALRQWTWAVMLPSNGCSNNPGFGCSTGQIGCQSLAFSIVVSGELEAFHHSLLRGRHPGTLAEFCASNVVGPAA
jgi:hypothetical protein